MAHARHIVHLTGQVAWGNNKTIIGPSAWQPRPQPVSTTSRRFFEEVGGGLQDLVSVTTWLMDRADLPQIQKVRARYLAFDNRPVSKSNMVAELGHPGFMVELTAIADVPESHFHAPGDVL